MERTTEKRGGYDVAVYTVDVTTDMKRQALDFATKIICTDNQYTRLLPENVRHSNDIDMKHKIEIQRTYIGKLGELAFVRFLNEKGICVNCDGMLVVYEGQNHVDSFDFLTKDNHTVDVKTGFRDIHKRLLVNVEQFNNNSKDYYAAIKLNAVDEDKKNTLVDWDSITIAKVVGYAEYEFMYHHAEIHDFGEGKARWLSYDRLLGIDRLVKMFK